MKTVAQIALARLESPDDLRATYSKSRHVTRDLIVGTIALNVLLVTLTGSQDELQRLKKVMRSFESSLKKQIIDYFSLYCVEEERVTKLLQ